MYESLGEELIDRASKARHEVLVVAPFIKVRALHRILEPVAPDLNVTVVTRWIPEEILAGISDIEVWPLLQSRAKATLRLAPRLHAKLFRFDQAVFVGSANVTSRALGWSDAPNLELLVATALETTRAFETHLRTTSFECDQRTYEDTDDLVRELQAQSILAPTLPVETAAQWVPTSRHVTHLFNCYRGRKSLVIESVYEDGVGDLIYLMVPPGLSEVAFNRFVAARLRDMPILGKVDSLAIKGIDRPSGQHLLVQTGLATSATAFDEWDTLSAWLLYFLADRYRSKMTHAGPVIDRSRLLT